MLCCHRYEQDIQHLAPATDFYKKLALDCSGQQVAVDLFLLSAQYCDLASLGEPHTLKDIVYFGLTYGLICIKIIFFNLQFSSTVHSLPIISSNYLCFED